MQELSKKEWWQKEVNNAEKADLPSKALSVNHKATCLRTLSSLFKHAV